MISFSFILIMNDEYRDENQFSSVRLIGVPCRNEVPCCKLWDTTRPTPSMLTVSPICSRRLTASAAPIPMTLGTTPWVKKRGRTLTPLSPAVAETQSEDVDETELGTLRSESDLTRSGAHPPLLYGILPEDGTLGLALPDPLHPAARLVRQGLGHKAGKQAVAVGDGLDDVAGDDVTVVYIVARAVDHDDDRVERVVGREIAGERGEIAMLSVLFVASPVVGDLGGAGLARDLVWCAADVFCRPVFDDPDEAFWTCLMVEVRAMELRMTLGFTSATRLPFSIWHSTNMGLIMVPLFATAL